MRSSSQTNREDAGDAVSARDLDQAGEHVGDFDAGEPLFSLRIDHDHGQAEAEVGDIGERMAGVERERRQDREDLSGKKIAQGPLFPGARSSHGQEMDARVGQVRAQLLPETRAHFFEHARDALRGWRPAAAGGCGRPGRGPATSARS